MARRDNQYSPVTGAWRKLKDHYQTIATLHMRDLFARDPDRAKEFSTGFRELLIDYSKHRITRETFDLLISLADAVAIKERIHDLLTGQKVNLSEERAALHTALRAPRETSLDSGLSDIPNLIHTELNRMQQFAGQLHQQEIKGATGKPINKVVNIGIGGSDLGPRLVVEALYEYRLPDIEIAFVANLDAEDLYRVLDDSDPGSTLFIITSKSFTTQETLANAQAAREWLINGGCDDTEKHFVAVSANRNATREFGVPSDRVFRIGDWVGGRYSLWSAVGLPIVISIGMKHFQELLAGAHEMDCHFLNEPAGKNIPVILAMLDVWYNNFFAAETHAVVPYDQRLRLLPDYLSQLIMESNGKGVTNRNKQLKHHSSPVFWGSVGTNAQHAFFQLLHQGTHLVPVDFLLPLQSSRVHNQHHKLVANCLAQSKALMLGQENSTEPYRDFPGNRPSTTIAYTQLTPRSLGMILAMYEHRTFTQAVVWDINPFDQWGVELGKQLAKEIINELEKEETGNLQHDSSTTLLIDHYLKSAR